MTHTPDTPDAPKDERPFWERKSLADMTRQEWESLCDGCGQCCLIKLQDVDSGAITTTDFSCAWLDCESCRCTDYANRQRNVPDCIALDPVNIYDLHWLPETCAYGLLARGAPLPGWHPLLSGDPESVHRAGISVRGRAIPERLISDDGPDDPVATDKNAEPGNTMPEKGG